MPKDNESAEEELRRQLAKNSFLLMRVLGQFNLGFIIAQYESDLFIIDQHASDEKFQFEKLENTTEMKTQKLICPLPMQLTSDCEHILLDNLPVFNRNGFEFEMDSEAEQLNRVKLTSVPYSKQWTFGKSDVDELLFMLQDATGNSTMSYRPSSVWKMLASRACRSAVMIGTPLNVGEMKRIISNMAKMDRPWNCPHGRPTIRHLANLDIL